MRVVLLTLGILGSMFAFGGLAEAQNYPWCAQYGGGEMGGGTNCGFTTYEQCMATLSGNGGFCNRNTQYVPPPGPHPNLHFRGARTAPQY
ncbi:MAG TPA: DUF3551 domain-containing protein [Xanthobacteraceae bacterium]|nr:DUF3551 domain-containing protein [Xanthobacteraceae bacterium]